MRVPACENSALSHTEAVRDGIVVPGYARGLCAISGRIVAGGSSPATVCLYDLQGAETLGFVRLSTDVRNTIHTIAVWPYT